MPIPSASVAPVLDDLKVELNITSDTHDDELQDKLDAAVAHLRSVNIEVESETVVETHRNTYTTGPLILKRRPVLSVESVTVNGVTVDPDTYDPDLETGMLHRAYGSYRAWYGPLVVTYTVGWSVLPADLREGVMLVAARFWETQRGNAPSALPFSDEGFQQDPGGLPLVSPRAEALLAPYRRGQRVP